MKKIFYNFSFLFFAILLVGVSGCTSIDSTVAPTRSQKGVYHKVQKGETLWRIAKTYQVDLDDIIRGNSIPNGAHLEENQLIFIPGAESVRSVPAATTTSTPRPRSTSTAPYEPVKDDFGWPVVGHVTRYFGEQRGYLNHGIAIETMEGQPVVASRQGKVVFADYLAGYSYTVILDHADGYFTVYGFNSQIDAKLGETVGKGEKIGLVGKKGNSPLLYFEIRRNIKAENPLYFLPKS